MFVGALDAGAGPEIVTGPMLLAGLGVGSLASQLGSVTVSSVSDEHSDEVGGLQNTITNLGISIGTALTGAIIIATLTTSFLTGIKQNPAVPAQRQIPGLDQARRRRPLHLRRRTRSSAEKDPRPAEAAAAIVEENSVARLDGLRTALSVLAILALVALLFTRRIPAEQPATAQETASATAA